MAVLFDRDKKELMITCRCECDNSLHIKIDRNEYDADNMWAYANDDFAWVSYTNGNFYRDQHGVWYVVKEKVKKIWAIIWNKDFYYSDVVMTREDFEQFRDFVNSVKLEA